MGRQGWDCQEVRVGELGGWEGDNKLRMQLIFLTSVSEVIFLIF